MDTARLETLEGRQAAIGQAVAGHADRVVALSRTLHATPELAFEEHHAVAAVTELLAAEGFTVEHGAGLRQRVGRSGAAPTRARRDR